MHGDDVASAGVSVSTQIVSKATEILLDMLKVAIEKEREAARKKQSEKQQVLSGGEVTYQKLKEGDEIAQQMESTNAAELLFFPFSSM